jgi:Flp pilus assembly protein TadG
MSLRKFFKNIRLGSIRQRGQTTLMVAIAMPVFIGGLTLLIDVGSLFMEHVRLQTGCDSAVLAGGNYLPGYPDMAVSTASQYAQANGILVGEITSITVASDQKSLSIAVTRNVPCYFCSALGISSANAAEYSAQSTGGSTTTGNGVSATATAAIIPIHSAIGVVPLGVDYQTNLNFGNILTLHLGVGPGNWDPLALGGNGANIYGNNLATGYPSLMTVGDIDDTEPGNINGPTQTDINSRISAGLSKYPQGTFAVHQLDDPRVMTIPIVDLSSINGKSQVPLKGFAVMWVASVDNKANITCYFIQESIPGAVPDPTAGVTYGATTPVVIR